MRQDVIAAGWRAEVPTIHLPGMSANACIATHSLNPKHDQDKAIGVRIDERTALLGAAAEEGEFPPLPSSPTEPTSPRRCCGRNVTAATWNELQVAALIALTLVFGGLNRVMGKIISVPMGDFSFFLGSFNGFFYAAFYYAIILVRYLLGNISGEMLRYPWRLTPHKSQSASQTSPGNWFVRGWRRIGPWKWFLLMGLNDGLANVLGLLAQPHVSGTMTALSNQLIVLFSAIAAFFLLGTRYTFWEMYSILIVLAGVVVTLIPTFEGSNEGSSIFFTFVIMFSTMPNAISFTLKEMLFIEEPTLDLFVVNSTASLFQLLLQPFFLPLTLVFNQTMGLPFLTYIRDAFLCFAGITPPSTGNDCSSNPYPYLIYIGINIIFNLLILMITKRASALLGFMAIKAVLPISILLFFFNWPLIGSAPLNYFVLAGLAVVLAGLVVFRVASLHKKRYHLQCGSCFVPDCCEDSSKTRTNHERPSIN